MAVKIINQPNIDDAQNAESLKYIKDGLQIITDNSNAGYQTAFPIKSLNNQGFTIFRDSFLKLLSEFEGVSNVKNLPDFFELKIKYSPIAQFKKWIFLISNRKFLMVSERKKEFENEFYFLFLDGNLFFQPIITNIAHEKFLLNLYDREKIPETTTTFSTFFDDKKKS